LNGYITHIIGYGLSTVRDFIDTAHSASSRSLWIWVGRVCAYNKNIDFINQMLGMVDVAKENEFQNEIIAELSIPNDQQAIMPYIIQFKDIELRRLILKHAKIAEPELFLKKTAHTLNLINTYETGFDYAEKLRFVSTFYYLNNWFFFKKNSFASATSGLEKLPFSIYIKITAFVLNVSEKKADEIRNQYLKTVPEAFYRFSLFSTGVVKDKKALFKQPIAITEKDSEIQREAYCRQCH